MAKEAFLAEWPWEKLHHFKVSVTDCEYYGAQKHIGCIVTVYVRWNDFSNLRRYFTLSMAVCGVHAVLVSPDANAGLWQRRS